MRHGDVRIVLVKKNKEEYTKLEDMTVQERLPVAELRKIASEKTGWEFVRLRERRGNRGRKQYPRHKTDILTLFYFVIIIIIIIIFARCSGKYSCRW